MAQSKRGKNRSSVGVDPKAESRASVTRAVHAIAAPMRPSSMPALMDGLSAVSEEQLAPIEQMYLLNEDYKAYADRVVDVPGKRLREAAVSFGTTPDEMAERWRARWPVDETFRGTYTSVKAINAGLVLAVESVRARHAYFCSEEMSAVVRSAANADALGAACTVADLPSPTGIAYLHDQAEPLVLRWASSSSGLASVNIASLTGVEKLLTDGVTFTGDDATRHVPQPFEQLRLSSPNSDEAPLGAEVLRPFGDSQYVHVSAVGAAALLLALTHLIKQERHFVGDPQEVKSRARDGRGRVRTRVDTVAYLTPRLRTGARASNPVGREYSHRWVVRGHWRRQWYPSQNRHVPIWITDYVAGPAEKPIVQRDRVMVVKSQE